MGSAAILALTMGALVATEGISKAEKQRKDLLFKADVAADNARVQRESAEVERHKGLAEQNRMDAEREALRRQYEDARGGRTSLMAASNVDMTSGSANNVLSGQANNFAAAMGNNRFDHAVSQWETAENVKQRQQQADIYDAQSSWIRKSAGNFGKSLLTGVLQGVSAGLSFPGFGGGQSPAGGWGKIAGNLAQFSKKP